MISVLMYVLYPVNFSDLQGQNLAEKSAASVLFWKSGHQRIGVQETSGRVCIAHHEVYGLPRRNECTTNPSFQSPKDPISD